MKEFMLNVKNAIYYSGSGRGRVRGRGSIEGRRSLASSPIR
jgi:hypothetical protein